MREIIFIILRVNQNNFSIKIKKYLMIKTKIKIKKKKLIFFRNMNKVINNKTNTKI